MSKRPNIIPSQQLNVALTLPIYTQLAAHLYSELEARVPHGAFSRFINEAIRRHFTDRQLDLALYLPGVSAGALTVSGAPEAILALQLRLKELT